MAFPFPIFPDGDVHITVGGEEYQLHAGLLMDRSPMMKLLLAPLLSERTSAEDHIHLAVVVQGRRDEVGYLAVVDQASTAHDSGSEGHASENDATEEQDGANEEDSDDEELSQATCEAWGNAFRCVYDLRVDLRSLDDEELLDHCWAILNITSHLGIKTEIVTWCISCGLAQRQGGVSRVISEDPVSWVILSRHMRLAWVFVESVTRLVEQWRTIPAERLQDVTMDTLNLCRTLRRSLLRGTFTGVEEDDCPWYAFPDSSEGDVPILDEVDDLRPLLPEFIALVNHWGMEDRGGQQPRLSHAELPVASSVEETSQAPQTDTTTSPDSQATDQLPEGDVEVVRAILQAW